MGKNNFLYTVELNGTSYNMPGICLCCGASSTTFKKLKKIIAYHKGEGFSSFIDDSDFHNPKIIQGSHSSTSFLEMQIPLCEFCIKHEEDLDKRFTRLIIASVVAIMLGLPLTAMIIEESAGAGISFGLIFIGPALLTLWSYIKYKLKLKKTGHYSKSPEDLIDIETKETNKYLFKFYSESFANEFAKLNNIEKVSEI